MTPTIDELRERAIKLGIPAETTFSINKRLKRALGRTLFRSRAGEIYALIGIDFNTILFDGNHDEELEETFLHECAHALVWLEEGGNHGHDAVWKAKARELGIVDPKATTDLDAGDRISDSDPKQYIQYYKNHNIKYLVRCTQCNQVVATRSRKCQFLTDVTNTDRYHSTCCDATLTIEEL